VKRAFTWLQQVSPQTVKYYAESPSGAKGPARAVALLDNMYDAYQFNINSNEIKLKANENFKKIYPIPNEL
jgi:hypothetical protein